MGNGVDQILKRAKEEAEIRAVLARNSRAIDRRDRSLLEGTYWQDGHCDYSDFRGPVPEVVNWLADRAVRSSCTAHILGQSLIELDGATARVATSVLRNEVRRTGDGGRVIVSTIRYLDRFERRDGEWRILRRDVHHDLAYDYPASNVRDEAAEAATSPAF